jgi:menaquinone-dependent protoporphyrinogen oxidase
MGNVLVLYATRQGQTAKIAARIAAVIRARGHGAELVDADRLPASIDVARFDLACIGGPIHARGYPRSVVRFVRRHRASLERIPSAFFSVGLATASRTTDGRAETQACVDTFVEKTAWHPRRVELIAGALPYTKYGFFIRWIMRRIAASRGGDTDTTHDYEYTDWDGVDRFATELVDGLAASSSAPPDRRLERSPTGAAEHLGARPAS